MLALLIVLVVLVAVALLALLAHLLDDDRRRNRHHYHRPAQRRTDDDHDSSEAEDAPPSRALVATLASGERVELELDDYYYDFEEMLADLIEDPEELEFVGAEDGRYLNLAHVVELKLEPADWRVLATEPLVE